MVNGQLCGCRGQISKSTWFGAGPRACTVHCAHGAGRLKAEDRRSAEDRDSEGKFHGTPPCEKLQKPGDLPAYVFLTPSQWEDKSKSEEGAREHRTSASEPRASTRCSAQMTQERQHPGSLGTSEAWMRRVTVKGMELFAWPHSMADLRGNKMSPSASGSSNGLSEVGQACGYKPR